MNDKLCEQLDEFLLGELELDVDERAVFQQHLEICAECRIAKDQQAIIESTLRDAAESVTVPVTLNARVRAAVQRNESRGRMTRFVVIAASTAVLLLGWILIIGHRPNRQSLPSQLGNQQSKSPKPLKSVEDRNIVKKDPPAVVQVQVSRDLLAVPIESGDPDVTLIQVFPVSDVVAKEP